MNIPGLQLPTSRAGQALSSARRRAVFASYAVESSNVAVGVSVVIALTKYNCDAGRRGPNSMNTMQAAECESF